MENTQIRTEHSRSIDDAETYRAIHTLVELGALTPVNEAETYHGRVGIKDAASEWAVDPGFANGSNDSGNSNVNNRPTLYTSDQQVAKDFANGRIEEVARANYIQPFSKRVAAYSPEERQEWLERENTKRREFLKNHSNPKLYTDEDLDGIAWREARRLEQELPENERVRRLQETRDNLRAEIHEIAIADSDATVLDSSFDASKLDTSQLAQYQEALRALAIPITEGSPVSFDERGTTTPFITELQAAKVRWVSDEEVAGLAAKAGIDTRTALQLASAFNTRQLVQVSPSYLVGKLVDHSTDILVDNLNLEGEKVKLPINLEYVQRYLRAAHIVGVKQSISSATLNRDITSVSLFDLEKITTITGLEKERQAITQHLGGLATELSELSEAKTVEQPQLLRLLTNAYAKPEKLIAAAKQVSGYAEIFDADAGNWEGFTLAEHTETVLRNFDENYADKMPVELLAPMRLAILTHDIGKPRAFSENNKHLQKEYNVEQANDFLDELGVEVKTKQLLLAMIGDGTELAFQIDVRKLGEPAEGAMKELAHNTLQEFNGTGQVTDDQINSFTEMCKILQICDGGAYTSMAITRRDRGGRYRNAPSFNSAFMQPLGFGKRGIKLRSEGGQPAASDLTSKDKKPASRVRISRGGAGGRSPNL